MPPKKRKGISREFINDSDDPEDTGVSSPLYIYIFSHVLAKFQVKTKKPKGASASGKGASASGDEEEMIPVRIPFSF